MFLCNIDVLLSELTKKMPGLAQLKHNTEATLLVQSVQFSFMG